MKKKTIIIGGIILIIGCITVSIVQALVPDKESNDHEIVEKPNQDEKTDEEEQQDQEENDDTGEIILKPDTPHNNNESSNNSETIEKEPFNPVVSLQQEVDNSYFDDSVFIGDSRTEGFMIYEDINSISYTHKGLMVDTIFTNPIVTQNGEKLTVMDALANTTFNKVYIMLGINETGWQSSDFFIQKYGEIIDDIKKINPNATIYIESILPVTQSVSTNHSYIKKAKIDEYNQLLMKMAAEKQVYYLDISSVLSTSEGYLPDDAAADGIHLNKQYCDKWLQYLKTHYIVKN